MTRCIQASIFIVLLAGLFSCQCVDQGLKSFQFSFPSNDHLAYARLENTIESPLSEFTLCYWARLHNIDSLGSVFSYSANGNYSGNQLLAVVSPHIRVYSGRQTTESTTRIPFGKWTHVCSTWSLESKKFLIYQNGSQVQHTIQGHPDGPVPVDGVIIIGQDQDEPGGKFDPIQTWHGDIAEVHLWDRILDQKDISDLSSCHRSDLEGNVISWRQAAFTFSGPVVLRPVTLCSDQ